MITFREGSSFNPSKPVSIYRNLHKNGPNGESVYSVQQSGLVVGYTSNVRVEDATFVVRPGGRESVRSTGRKIVHAFVRGTVVPDEDSLDGKATYNPYKNETFVDRFTGEELHKANVVRVCSTGVEYL